MNSSAIANIVIVEDESIVALDLKNRLRSLGYQVVGIADRGESAVDLVLREKPNLVLMDLRLKGTIDGIDTADLIHQSFDVPIVFLTAFGDEETFERVKASGGYGYLLKPFQERDLRISVEMALNTYSMEKALRENREWLDGALNAIADGILALDSEDRVVFVNQTLRTWLNIDDESLRGRPLAELCVFRPMSDSFSRSGGEPSAMFLETPKGLLPVASIRYALHHSARGAALSAGGASVLCLHDISAEIKAEASRSLVQAIVANTKDSVFAIDEKCRILTWNSGAENAYGLTEDEAKGAKLLDFTPTERDKAELRNAVQRLFVGGEAERLKALRRHKSGRLFTVALSLSPVQNSEGRVSELACVERDIGAEMAYEASLVEAKRLAEEASRSKSEFLSNVSHELRTPLNSIIGMISLALQDSHGGDSHEALNIVRQSAENLLRLINTILDFSKIEAGKLQMSAAPFSPIESVENCLEAMSIQAYRKGLELLFSFDAACPSLCVGDSQYFGQIVYNLVSNAIKFTENGRVLVELRWDSRSERLSLAVSDTGIGIPTSRMDAIWERFTQLDGSSTRSYGGTGLGLTIVKSLVGMMGGTVTVESALGQGSVFTAVLPLSPAKGSAPVLAPDERLSEAIVVVVSSSREDREVLNKLLDALGCHVILLDSVRSLSSWLEGAPSEPPFFLLDERLTDRALLTTLFTLDSHTRGSEAGLPAERSAGQGNTAERPGARGLAVLSAAGVPLDPFWRNFSPAPYVVPRPPRHKQLKDWLLKSLSVSDGPEAEKTARDTVRENTDKTRAEARTSVLAPLWFESIELDALPLLERFLKECDEIGEIHSPRFENTVQRYRHSFNNINCPLAGNFMLKLLLHHRKGATSAVREELTGAAAHLHKRVNKMVGGCYADFSGRG